MLLESMLDRIGWTSVRSDRTSNRDHRAVTNANKTTTKRLRITTWESARRPTAPHGALCVGFAGVVVVGREVVLNVAVDETVLVDDTTLTVVAVSPEVVMTASVVSVAGLAVTVVVVVVGVDVVARVVVGTAEVVGVAVVVGVHRLAQHVSRVNQRRGGR